MKGERCAARLAYRRRMVCMALDHARYIVETGSKALVFGTRETLLISLSGKPKLVKSNFQPGSLSPSR